MSSLLAEPDTHTTVGSLNLPPVVGLSGFARVGKDTVGRLLGAYGYTQKALADPLRDALLTLNPIVSASSYGGLFRYRESVEEYGYEDAKDLKPEIRRLLQTLGDSWKTTFGDNVFAEALLKSLDPVKRYVVTDVRYDEEAERLREEGAVIIRIDRPGYGKSTDHRSDRVVSDHLVDFVLRNDGAQKELVDEVADVMQRLHYWMSL